MRRKPWLVTKLPLTIAFSVFAILPAASAGEGSISASALVVSTDTARQQDAQAEDGTGFDLTLLKPLDVNHGIAVSYSGWLLDAGIARKGIDALSLNYLIGNLDGNTTAYFLLGAGYARADLANGDSHSYPVFSSGVGGSIGLTPSIAITSKLLWHKSMDNKSVASIDSYEDLTLSVGLNWTWGQTENTAEKSKPTPPKAPSPKLPSPSKSTTVAAPKVDTKPESEICTVGKVYTAYFSQGSAELSTQDKIGIRALAEKLAGCGNQPIEIRGFTAPSATNSASWIADRRANQVQTYLCDRVIDCNTTIVKAINSGRAERPTLVFKGDRELLARKAEIWIK
ncbi:MAG: OmpA family protein [Gammaproteobacteria bacterium]|nr:OmpA family protein [Gammaproteobacteria bacterium]